MRLNLIAKTQLQRYSHLERIPDFREPEVVFAAAGCSPRGQEQERHESARALNPVQIPSNLLFNPCTSWVSSVVLFFVSWELCFILAV